MLERWKEIERQTDLQALAYELERLRTESIAKRLQSREDDRQVALLAVMPSEEAEKGNGAGVASLLSKAGKGVLKMAKDIGTDVAAKVIAELIKPGLASSRAATAASWLTVGKSSRNSLSGWPPSR